MHKFTSFTIPILLATLSALSALAASHPATGFGNLDSPTLISDEDQAIMRQIKHHIGNEYADFKTVGEVHAFLEKVKLLVQKHPKNIAFAQGDRKDLLNFLSQEVVTKLVRVDTDAFVMPIAEDRIPVAQRAVDEDELTRKLFGGPLRLLVEARKQQVTRHDDGNHKDGNFFASFWCKLSGGCSNQ